MKSIYLFLSLVDSSCKISFFLETEKVLKHRSVQHFGHEFLYGSNNIDRSTPLTEKIPEICRPLIEKLLEKKLIDFSPDQLTINQYEPGQGKLV